MNIKYDYDLDLATAHSRLSTKWRNKKWKWSEILQKCAEPKRTNETSAEYAKMVRDEQSSIKDVGGFVGGYLNGGVRKTSAVLYRSMATLDIDYGTENVWNDFVMERNWAAMLYSTHKHTRKQPRYRLVIPFSRKVKPAEYEAICRKIAAEIGIDLFDVTTYQLARLFYWPSASKDGDYVFEYQDGPLCDVDEILAGYVNPADASAWPIGSRENDIVVHEMRKAGDPLERQGLIGAFCRTYTIEEIIDNFLSDVYEPTAMEGRYTYKAGSVAGGLVCYEHKFAYSHHETDPASRQLCNAFDLCRIHLYGMHDEDSRATDVTRLPSYAKMQEFAAADKAVRILLAKEKSASAAVDFEQIDTEDAGEAQIVDTGTEWLGELEVDKRGAIKSTSPNIVKILENDNGLKGHLWHDLFSGFDIVKGGLPWDKSATTWGAKDDANLRIYLEEKYGVSGKDKVKDAKDAILTKHRMHPIRDYLNSLKWDGVPRLERLIIDYIGAEDTTLNRTMTKIHFTAAVKRAMQPGCKYDYCLILTGAEGIGKSTLFATMGGEWFNDSLTTSEGKMGMEQLLRSWIIEMGEITAMKRSDVEQMKNYISRQDDIYRGAYQEVVESHPRQCIFCGTTNEDAFLKGDRGNRRFWIIHVDPAYRKVSDFVEALKNDRDQMWAEATEYYRQGIDLFLPRDLEMEARRRQTEYNDDKDDPIPDMLETFLEMKLPVDWDDYDLLRRRAYISNPDPLDADGVVVRDKMCVAEFICEYMKRDRAGKEYKYLARKITKIMTDMDGWEKVSLSRHVEKLYGRQKAFKRIIESKNEDEI